MDFLKFYVYIYVDPRNNQTFYVGKGRENRVFYHLDDTAKSAKVARISEIRSAGIEPRIELLCYGLTDDQASLVEASVIDLLGLDILTNACRGIHKNTFGRVTIPELEAMLNAPPVDIKEKTVLFTINQLYRSSMTAEELYEATRGVWKVSRRRCEAIELAMAVFRGVIREVYRVHCWSPAGTHDYKTRNPDELRKIGRWEFEGEVATDVRGIYVGKSVGPGGQNPVRYVNV